MKSCTARSIAQHATEMSAFSHRLRAVIDESYGGNQSMFADACGVTLSTISRLSRQVTVPQPETLAQFAERLPREQAATLCAAWLTDLLPPNLTYLIRIAANAPDSPNSMHDARPDAWAQLDQPTRDALSVLAELAVRSSEARDFLLSTAAFLRGEQVLSIEAETAVNLATAKVSRTRPTKPSTRK